MYVVKSDYFISLYIISIVLFVFTFLLHNNSYFALKFKVFLYCVCLFVCLVLVPGVQPVAALLHNNLTRTG